MFIREGGTTMFVEFKRPDGRGVVSNEQKLLGRGGVSGYSHSLLITLKTSRKD